jgi:hypothetical protein
MALVMGELRTLANAGASVVVLHHKPKGEASHYRGSSDIRAGVDLAYAVSQDRDAGLVKFACFKNRLAPEFAFTLRPQLESRGDFEVYEGDTGRAQDGVARLRELIEQNPGLSQNQVIRRSGLPEKRVREVLRQQEGRAWRVEAGVKGARCYYPVEVHNGLSAGEASDA